MKIRYLAGLTALAAGLVGTAIGVNANASTSPTTVRTSHTACVEHGKPGQVAGNWMLYDWNNSACPAGTYPASLAGTVSLPSAASPVTEDFSTGTNVVTGGSFVTGSTEVGTVVLQPGTYLVSVNAKATPTGGSEAVFPQFFVYNQAKNANFTGDLFNVGAGALAAGSTSLDSYYSGSDVIKLTAATTLHLYAFGYSPDKSAGTFTLDDLTVTAVPLP